MYDLHNLGWHSFQQLCSTIAREILGQTVESYLDSNDGGRDGAFCGQWNPTAHERLSGRFVIQCKFSNKHARPLRLSTLKDEIAKARRLVDIGRCDTYILMTNSGVSGRQAEKIESLFKDVGVKHVAVFGGQWITQQIVENKRLRMLVPRVYGLGDLGQILDERAYAQARAVLDSLREDLSKVVITDAYNRAAKAVGDDNFVLLIGEPAAGKTTIASLLAMAAVDLWGASLLKIDDPAKVIDHWNPEEPSQFFWIDDAFGVTQYEESLVRGWNHIFPQVKTMLRQGAKVVMTSRDYIYNRARNDLKSGAFPLLRESQVVIDVHALAAQEKKQILYNHLKLGTQSRAFLKEAKPHLEAIASHPRFIPETARRFGDPLFTKGIRSTQQQLMDFVERREKFLDEVLSGLDQHSRAALALIYMRKDHLQSPIVAEETEERAISRLGSDLGKSILALDALNGSLVINTRIDGDSIWRFKHPTIGDAYAASLGRSPELLGIFVHGSSTENLLDQITCGDVGREKAVVIPRSLFPAILDRLDDFSTTTRYKSEYLSSWGAERTVHHFLTWRCSKDFLVAYIDRHPDLLERVAVPGLYLDSVSEVGLAVRLNEFTLLPEPVRAMFVEAVHNYAVKGQDLYALSDGDIRSVFSDEEFSALLAEVRTELLPKLDDLRARVQSESSSDSREGEIEKLIESFEALKCHFGDEEQVRTSIEREIECAKEWLHDHRDESYERPHRSMGDLSAESPIAGSRSIFDDVDA